MQINRENEMNVALMKEDGFREIQPEVINLDEANFLTEERVKNGVAITSEIFKEIDAEFSK